MGSYCCHVGCMKKKIMQGLQQKEASRKSTVTIYVKRALRRILEIAKVALHLIAGALFGFSSAYIGDIIIEVFEL
ncbi:hypothetical protein NL676_037149 [Syzygium grande]|nr:hypothetical protein NL676_037149 [Syzygium grande]